MKDEPKQKVVDMHPHELTNFLLKETHNIGGFRDQADIDIAKHHTHGTLVIFKDLIENVEWTKEEMITFLESNIEGLDSFVPRQ